MKTLLLILIFGQTSSFSQRFGPGQGQNPPPRPPQQQQQPLQTTTPSRTQRQTINLFHDVMTEGHKERIFITRRLRLLARSRQGLMTVTLPDGNWYSIKQYYKPHVPGVAAYLKHLKSIPQGGYYPTLVPPFTSGKVGVIRAHMTISQVVDENNSLVKICFNHEPDNRKHYCKDAHIVWINNVPTKGIVDDQETTCLELLEVVGRQQYTNVIGGRRTVPLLRPFDLSEERREEERQRWKP